MNMHIWYKYMPFVAGGHDGMCQNQSQLTLNALFFRFFYSLSDWKKRSGQHKTLKFNHSLNF